MTDFARRDAWLSKLANFILRFASPAYQKWVEGSIQYGLASAARDSREGRDAPLSLDEEIALTQAALAK